MQNASVERFYFSTVCASSQEDDIFDVFAQFLSNFLHLIDKETDVSSSTCNGRK